MSFDEFSYEFLKKLFFCNDFVCVCDEDLIGIKVSGLNSDDICVDFHQILDKIFPRFLYNFWLELLRRPCFIFSELYGIFLRKSYKVGSCRVARLEPLWAQKKSFKSQNLEHYDVIFYRK